MHTEQAIQLLNRYQEGTASPEEVVLVERWYEELVFSGDIKWNTEEIESYQARIRSKITQEIEKTPLYKLPARRKMWMRYAAAIIIMAGIGSITYYMGHQTEKPAVTQKVNPAPLKNDVEPGGNRATLTLADGSKIVLDSTADGVIATEGGIIIQKNNNKLLYPSQRDGLSADGARSGVGSTAYAINMVTTPRGGQYQLTLPDGSQVWLNAESTITYPTAFVGNERKVTITGEAYFDVKTDKRKPFKVAFGDQVVEVFGTKFNINSYKEEPTLNTTLLEGSVRLTSVHTSLVLKPGQQGQWNPRNENLSLAVHPDVEQAVAWTNGVFNFNNVKLEEAMRQISRWYDVQVIYEKEIPATTFGGKMGRDLRLSQVLKLLGEMGINFRIEGRKIIVQ